MSNNYENIKEWNETEIILKNIIEGGKGNRFEFTSSELRALDFSLKAITANKLELFDDKDV